MLSGLGLTGLEWYLRAITPEVLGKARPRYHAVTTRTVDQILGWSSD